MGLLMMVICLLGHTKQALELTHRRPLKEGHKENRIREKKGKVVRKEGGVRRGKKWKEEVVTIPKITMYDTCRFNQSPSRRAFHRC